MLGGVELMRYLVVEADYQGTGIRDEYAGPAAPTDLGIPDNLTKRLLEWVERYSELITGTVERTPERIKVLDAHGVALAQEVQDLLGDQAKVAYYSEGLHRRLIWRPPLPTGPPERPGAGPRVPHETWPGRSHGGTDRHGIARVLRLW